MSLLSSSSNAARKNKIITKYFFFQKLVFETFHDVIGHWSAHIEKNIVYLHLNSLFKLLTDAGRPHTSYYVQ